MVTSFLLEAAPYQQVRSHWPPLQVPLPRHSHARHRLMIRCIIQASRRWTIIRYTTNAESTNFSRIRRPPLGINSPFQVASLPSNLSSRGSRSTLRKAHRDSGMPKYMIGNVLIGIPSGCRMVVRSRSPQRIGRAALFIRLVTRLVIDPNEASSKDYTISASLQRGLINRATSSDRRSIEESVGVPADARERWPQWPRRTCPGVDP